MMTTIERHNALQERVTRLVLVLHLETTYNKARAEEFIDNDSDAGWVTMRHEFSHLIPASQDSSFIVRVVRNHWQAWYMDGMNHITGELLADTNERMAEQLRETLTDIASVRIELGL